MENEETDYKKDCYYHAKMICLSNSVRSRIDENRKHRELINKNSKEINESIHRAIEDDRLKHGGIYQTVLEPMMKRSDDIVKETDEKEKRRRKHPDEMDMLYDDASRLFDTANMDAMDNPPF